MNGKQAKALRKAAVLAHDMRAFYIGPILRGTTRYKYHRPHVIQVGWTFNDKGERVPRMMRVPGTLKLEDCPRRTMQQLKKAKRAA